MAIELITTVSGQTSNSFLTIAAMDARVALRLFSKVWTDLETEDEKSLYLIESAKLMNNLNWLGQKASSNQSLALPRINLPKADGIVGGSGTYFRSNYPYRDVYASDAIPEPGFEAQMEIAIALVQGGQYGALSGNVASASIGAWSLGDVSVSKVNDSASPSSILQLPRVRQILRGLIVGAQRSL